MSRKFWLFIAALVVLMLVLEYQMPRRFVWEPTFAHDDRQPFGCYVFDSVFSREMPHGYIVCRKSLSQLSLQNTTPCSILILCDSYHREELINVDTLLSLAQRGFRILYASSYFRHELSDTLDFAVKYHSSFIFRDFQSMTFQRDSVFWVGDTGRYAPTLFRFYRMLIGSRLLLHDSVPSEKLARVYDENAIEEAQDTIGEEQAVTAIDPQSGNVADCVAVSYPIGRGEVILVSSPLMLTNYGILDCPAYVHRLMNRLKDLPVVRTEAYMPNYNVAESSPFRELLKRPPLRWSLYLVLLGIVLFMGFNARRRQRAIPVEAPPRNYQLEFIRHIGTLKFTKLKKTHTPHHSS